MAYKRTTKKTGPNTRSSITHNTNGPSTFSHSAKGGGGVTYTSTSKGGKYYTTRTQRFANGYVERKRIMSSSPKRGRPAKDKPLGPGGAIILIIVLVLLGLALGG